MELKATMNPNSIAYEADSSLDKGANYPFIEPCLIANYRMMVFNEIPTPCIGELLVIAMLQNKLENNSKGILTARWLIGKSILNN
jgi:hypothetical protein